LINELKVLVAVVTELIAVDLGNLTILLAVEYSGRLTFIGQKLIIHRTGTAGCGMEMYASGRLFDV
jgi:hypothetical protein